MRALSLMTAVLALAGCGKPSLEASCRRAAAAQCRKFFECARSFAEAQYTTEGNCVSQFNSFCDLYRNYECDDLSAYERCISDYSASGCSTITPSSCNSPGLTSSCRVTGGGGATCGATNTNNTGSGCTLTLSQCSDGKVYTLSCSGSNCTCSDGSSNRSVFSSCSSASSAIATCGWNVRP